MTDFSFLFELEKQSHSFEVRSSASKISLLLSPNFFEHGSSGRIWSRNEILERLPTEDGSTKIKSRDYKATPLAADVVLITYISANQEGDAISGEFLRSSIWRKNPTGWQMEFHQGTRKQ
ncbi:DUF4440 domain-containing protein [Pedosphaera parvula]|uniref:DUF4440 domain-containing protein n=1 Tax=Pedosphaera parvula (strain Ellin514) TaxID=320771 RepID=B9XRR8_PEDPL|nr:nuclear transport factor 2 family protein [Pedosphaera parvula]EEF57483.1 conserved hypothetical protein [Pedosphaera parvula Ellin514]